MAKTAMPGNIGSPGKCPENQGDASSIQAWAETVCSCPVCSKHKLCHFSDIQVMNYLGINSKVNYH
jgi:hypothetical protein